MGCLITASGGRIIRTSSISISALAPFTLAGWAKWASFPASYGKAGMVNPATDTGNMGCGQDNTGKLCRITTGYGVIVASPTADVWYYCIVRGDGATMYVRYYNADGSTAGTGSTSQQNYAIARVGIGADSFGNQPMAGKYAYWRLWDADIGYSGVEAEQFAASPVNTSDLVIGFDDSDQDISANNYDWTHTGSVTFDSDTPPVNLITPIVMTWTL